MNKKIWVVLIIVMVASSAIVIFSEPMRDKNFGENAISNTFPKANHAPIKINSDEEFQQMAHDEGWNGDGTESSPFVIKDLVIDGKNAGISIYIANITVNFTIKNCILYNASGTSYTLDHENSGILLRNVTAKNIYILNNSVYNNDGAGIFLYDVESTGFHLGDSTYGYMANRIYANGRAGIYVSHSSISNIDKNMVYRNDVGIHLYYLTGPLTIHGNGIALNTHEGIRIVHSDHVEIYQNLFYKNNGTMDYYTSKHFQASQDSSSSNIQWYHDFGTYSDGNFWYDWAVNNNTNYDAEGLDFVIPWSYPIYDSSGTSKINEDKYPLKGVYRDPFILENKTTFERIYNPDKGFVGTDEYGRMIMTGLEIQDFMGDYGYGIIINGTFSRPIIIDGMIIHDIDSKGSTYHWTLRGNGLIINNTYSILTFTHLDIYNFYANGVAISNYKSDSTKGYAEGLFNWIHDGGAGSTGVYLHGANCAIKYSTIEGQGHWGIYIDSNTNSISLLNNIIQKNLAGLTMASNLDNLYLFTYSNSFFNNTGYAILAKNSTNSYVLIYLNVFARNNGAGVAYNASHTQVYAEVHSNVSTIFTDTLPPGNYYEDYANNNRSNDMNNDGLVDWAYSFDGGNITDPYPRLWVEHYVWNSTLELRKAPIFVNETNAGHLRTSGTYYGITGVDGYYGYSPEYYYIMGWNNTESYTAENGYEYGIYLKSGNGMNYRVYNVNMSNADYGIYADGEHSIDIENSLIASNQYIGVLLNGNYYVSIKNSHILLSYHGLYISNVGREAHITGNWIFANAYNGAELSGSSSASFNVTRNCIFENGRGIYGYQLENSYIENNGFAYNEVEGVRLYTSYGNKVYNNTFYMNNGSNGQAYDNGNNEWNDSHYGNYWNEWAMNNETNDADGDNIVDYPYNIQGGTMKDMHPYLYRNHKPIRINNLGDLDWEHGFVGGDGSSTTPYAIVGWDLDGTDHEYGLYIGNITQDVYMTVFGVHTHHSTGNTGNNHGVYIYNFKGSHLRIQAITSNNNYGNGIEIYKSENIYIDSAYLYSSSYAGVEISESSNVSIAYSNISYNHYEGILGMFSDGIDIQYNEIYKNGVYGVYLNGCTNTQGMYGDIYNNTIKLNNNYGLYLTSTSGYTVHRNIFDRNNGASGDGNYDSSHIQAYDDESTEYTNLWNTSTEGNCWSDWNQATPYQLDPSPYVAKDRKPGCGFVPEFFNGIYIVLFAMVILAIQRRYRKNR